MQDVLNGLVWVALGSAFGGSARFFLSGFVGRHIGETFPWGTMVVNASGAFVIGVAAAVAGSHAALHLSASWQFAVIGFLGSYTTVSSFSLQTLALVRDGEFLRAGGNIVLSLVLCLTSVTLGFAVGATLLGAS